MMELQKKYFICLYMLYEKNTAQRMIFDASAKSSSGVSQNDTLLIGPTVHSSLIDVLLRFRLHRVVITADVSKMYRVASLAADDRDLHRFVWRGNLKEQISLVWKVCRNRAT